MAYKRISPQPVAEGGTGAATLTGILIGNGTSAVGVSTVTQYGTVIAGASNTVSSVAPSATAGVPLVSAGASSNPAYGTAVVGGGGTGVTSLAANTLLQGGTTVAASNSLANDFTATTASAGVTRFINVSNTDNSDNTSHAEIRSITGGTSGGDPFINFTITGASSVSMGLDNSDSDTLKITDNAAGPSGGTTIYSLSTAGLQKLPLQSSFSAYLSADADDQTGDGSAYTIAFNSEQWDQAANYAANTFTAPIAGKYLFNYKLSMDDIGAAHTGLIVEIGGVTVASANPFLLSNAVVAGTLTLTGSVILSLAASATVTMVVTVSGSTKTVDIKGTTAGSLFQGQLLC